MYGLSEREAMNLSDAETKFLYDKAENTLIQLAQTSPQVQALLRPQIAPTLKAVQASRTTPVAATPAKG
jgi:hypothetical protein